MRNARAYAHDLLEGKRRYTRWGRAVNNALIFLIAVSVISIVLEGQLEAYIRTEAVFAYIEAFVICVFTVEYGVRVWAYVESPECEGLPPWRARLRQCLRPLALIDLLVIAPFWLSLLGLMPPLELTTLRLLRLARILKLAHYSDALKVLFVVLRKESHLFLHFLYILGILLTVVAFLIHLLERHHQPEIFGTMSNALWWAIVTMTTVGYGDTVPVTGAGRLVASGLMVMGIAVSGIWTGVFAAAFLGEFRQRRFPVDWADLRLFPMFADCPAARLRAVAPLLSSEVALPRHALLRRGERRGRVYFILSGEAEADGAGARRAYGPGDVLNAEALEGAAPVAETVIALEDMRVLALAPQDFDDFAAARGAGA